MKRKILSYDVSGEKIFLLFSLLGNSIPNVVHLSGRRRMALGMVSIKELEAENRRLKKELQVALGKAYERP